MAERRSQKALADFVAEAQEIIDGLGRDLMALESSRHGDEPDPQTLNAVFRAAHSLKGLSSMFGVERMTQLAHALEDQLDAVRMGRRALDGPTLDVLLEAPEVFSLMIAEESAGGPANSGGTAQDLVARLRQAGKAPEVAGADPLVELDLDPAVLKVLTEYEEHRLRANLSKGVKLFKVRAAFDLATFDKGLAELNARLKSLGEVVSTLPSSEVSDPNIIAFEILYGSKEPLERLQKAAGEGMGVEAIGRRAQPAGSPTAVAARPASQENIPHFSPDPEAEPSAPPVLAPAPGGGGGGGDEPPAQSTTGSIRSVSQAVRVDIRKLDRLMNIVGELVLARTNLFKLAERLKGGEDGGLIAAELRRENRNLERKLNELQTDILDVRMVPLGQIFDKLTRMVRKIGKEVGKEIHFEVSGDDVELDKLIVEDLSDPLMHLLRNAVDHAIEAPEVRVRAGKPRAGRLRLSADQKGNHVQIVVEDDGSGIDESRVRQVAVERGLMSAKAIQELSRRELLNLIFLPGFSTVREVTALSGRGVGMDVVKNNIAGLSGIIDLQSEPGKGTRFEITLPVTLAIIRALVVKVAERTYAVPLNSVLEILSVDPSELRVIERREIISLRGSTLPIVRMARLFGHTSGPTPDEQPLENPFWPAQTPGAEIQVWPPPQIFVVVVGLAQERLGLAVDDLVGQQDIVVKPLGKALQGLRGISGATDLGNRCTVLVLDIGAIIEEVMGADPFREAIG
jgi:two-component system chemotaxis sensor kinase CheA